MPEHEKLWYLTRGAAISKNKMQLIPILLLPSRFVAHMRGFGWHDNDEVICPQQLDQLFWAERIRYLAVGSVMERSLFVGPESPSSVSRNALVAKAASGIMSALTPQVCPVGVCRNSYLVPGTKYCCWSPYT